MFGARPPRRASRHWKLQTLAVRAEMHPVGVARMTIPTQAPVSDAVIVSVLQDSAVELQTLRKKLFANDQRAAGMVLAQLRLIFSRLQQGLPSRRSDYLSLLQAAQRVPEEKR